MKALDRERRLVAALISFCSEKKGQERSILPLALSPASNYQSSVKRSFFRRVYLTASSSPSYVGRSARRQSLSFSVESSVLRRPFRVLQSVIRLPLSVEPCVDCSIFRLLLVAPSCVPRTGRKECRESCVCVPLCLSDSGQLRSRAGQRRGAI